MGLPTLHEVEALQLGRPYAPSHLCASCGVNPRAQRADGSEYLMCHDCREAAGITEQGRLFSIEELDARERERRAKQSALNHRASKRECARRARGTGQRATLSHGDPRTFVHPKMCACGYHTDWKAAWANHTKHCPIWKDAR